ncbi:hypothetical protein BSR28_06990 [Boudabousia liubingyangii]|uniref:McrC family protein n=1 Tax=Boudabousia liubingyangii TaxID=1921764 RepID=UPI000938CA4D|nr:hypothetical protein [Boudabousia liubingyangii]OKL46279.1 hypothetical protein BSR28_06990 [Boudabousia liubingyangii]
METSLESVPVQRFRTTENKAETFPIPDLLAQKLIDFGLADVFPTPVSDHWRVVPKLNRVGLVAVNGFEFQVEPKVPVQNLFAMLAFEQDLELLNFLASSSWQDSSLSDLLIGFFARLCDRALNLGLMRDYQKRDERSNTVRGRIDFSAQIRQSPGTWLPLQTTYHHYSVDCAENQILKSVTVALLGYQYLGSENFRVLQRLERQLSEVSVVPLGADLPEVYISRLNEHYGPVLRLARAIWQGMNFSQSQGRERSFSFVFDMAKIFERFGSELLRQAWQDVPGAETILQAHYHLDEGQEVSIYPDVVLADAGDPETVRVVADMKYKRALAREDIYQLVSYCGRLGLAEGHLLYAGGAEDVVKVRGIGVRIFVHVVDLSLPIGQVCEQVRGLAERMLLGE